jgi:hypothetical protein
MELKKVINRSHPHGEQKSSLEMIRKREAERVINSYGGAVRVSWNEEESVTPFGQLAFFVEFLKTADLFDPWVKECPLKYASNNGTSARDLLGTTLLSVLAGHKRYSHVTSIRGDRVNPELLGMTKVVSEDSVRRGFLALSGDMESSDDWLSKHLKRCYEPLLEEPWVLDIDTTIKPLYGKQEGAVVGYNPHKPGRPSHAYHTYMAGNLRLILDVEVEAGNRTAASYGQPGLWKYLDGLSKSSMPKFIRGDCAWGNESVMKEAEARGVNYLFKLKITSNVKKLISRAFYDKEWEKAGQGWEGVKEELQLTGWTRKRRVVILRRKIKNNILIQESESDRAQLSLCFVDADGPILKYEYAVLVTSLYEEVVSLAQLYRDRADMENVFDEMKNQWGWGGFTTADLSRCRIMARISALVFNWWSLFAGLAFPDKHAEAITSRPMLLHAIGRQTKHAGQKRLTITSAHGKSKKISKILTASSRFLQKIQNAAEQLSSKRRWQIILSRIFMRFLKGKILGGQLPHHLRIV